MGVTILYTNITETKTITLTERSMIIYKHSAKIRWKSKQVKQE